MTVEILVNELVEKGNLKFSETKRKMGNSGEFLPFQPIWNTTEH